MTATYREATECVEKQCRSEVPLVKVPVPLVGDEMMVPCIDGVWRRYVGLDAAASTGALPSVMDRVQDFVPFYSSVHRGAGYKSQRATAEYEGAREAALRFAGREGRDDVVIICRNTTEAINHLVYRLRLSVDDVVATTVIEHHANLLPWSRVATLPLRGVRPRWHLRRRGRHGRPRRRTSSANPLAHRSVEHHRVDAAPRGDH